MHRHLLLLICVLSLVTGSTLLAIGATVRQPAVRKPIGTGHELIGLARAFYDAVNVTFATGDTEELDEIVAADLVEHPARAGVDSGRAGLIVSLHSHRMLFPGLRLVVDELTITGEDRVTARVHTVGGADGSFLGLSTPPTLGEWGPLDLFRIADGRIVERWGSLADPLVAESLGEAALSGDPLVRTGTLVVSRVRLAPGAAMEVGAVLTSELLVVTEGTLHVTDEGQPSRAIRPGEHLRAPPASTATLTNEGDEPAVAFTIALWSIDVSPSSVSTGTDNDDHFRHTGSVGQWQIPFEVEMLIAIPTSPELLVRAGRVVLAPGTAVSIPAEDRLLVVVVEDGGLEIVKQRDVIATKLAYMAGTSTVMETGSGGTLRAEDGSSASLLLVEILTSSTTE